jgi:hypothetical protein
MLWTHHPVRFRINDPGILRVDPSQGPYWACAELSYESSQRALCEALGADQFLWCSTVNAWISGSIHDDIMEWSLNVPESEVLAFIDEPVWDGILRGSGRPIASAIITHRSAKPAPNVSALVRFPLLSEWKARCWGPAAVPAPWRADIPHMRSGPPALRQKYLDRYRAIANGECGQENTRRKAIKFLEYLETEGIRIEARW